VLKDAFFLAHTCVCDSGFLNEIEWQDSASLDNLQENTFLQEYAWVVLTSGMSEFVIRSKFCQISECFYSWRSAESIANHADACIRDAMQVFRHAPKIRAIASTATTIAKVGFQIFKRRLCDEPMPTLRTLPYIGPVTQYHLAKNIGFDVAKPDRHLVRIARLFGFLTVHEFCTAVASEVGFRIAVVDLVFWRFATLKQNYLDTLQKFV
jgi:hypothetical protein